jgi:hypothetical protein
MACWMRCCTDLPLTSLPCCLAPLLCECELPKKILALMVGSSMHGMVFFMCSELRLLDRGLPGLQLRVLYPQELQIHFGGQFEKALLSHSQATISGAVTTLPCSACYLSCCMGPSQCQ